MVVAFLAAVPLALAAGARRTATAPDRYEASSGHAADVLANQDDGPVLTEDVAALPAARKVEAITFLFGQLATADGAEVPEHIVFAGSPLATSDRIVDGRLPDRDIPGEFVMTKPFADVNGLAVGDAMRLVTLSPEQVAETGFNPRPDMLTTDAVLVGLIDGPGDLNDASDVVVFSPSLLADERIGTSGSVLAIELADGVSVEELRQQLDSIPGGDRLRLERASIVTAETRSAVGTQALGLWILAGLAAVATIVALGQLIVRHTRLTDEDTSTLSALGAPRAQIVGETTARAGIIVAIALALAACVAMSVSGIFPFGFVRRVEPRPGFEIDPLVISLGALVLALGLAGWVALTTRVRRSAPVDRHFRVVDGVAARCHSPALATGVRFAYSSVDSASLASRLGTALLMLAALVGTLTFAVSLRSLVTEPSRYGFNFDALLSHEADEMPKEALTFLQTDPDITDVTLYTETLARVEDHDETLYVAGMELTRGVLEPQLLAGRLPVGSEEIAIGRVSARKLDASIGDRLRLFGDGSRARYEITGLIVPQQIRGNDLIGQGAIVTRAGYARLDPECAAQAVGILVRPGASKAALQDRIVAAFGLPPESLFSPSRPSAITNLARITYVPFVLSVLLAILAFLVVLSAVYTGVRRRRHDVAVLRSMGADRRWLVRAAQWQAVVATLVPVAIGVPLGVLAGRLVFRAYADNLGTVNDAVLPAAAIVVGLGILIAVAAIAATAAGREARRTAPAELLRAE